MTETKFVVEKVINVAKYPIENPESGGYQSLLARCRQQLGSNGACELPGFLTDQGLKQLVTESQILSKKAYFNRLVGNAYLEATDPELPEDHPRRQTEPTSLGVIAYDEYPRDSLLRQIYELQPLMDLVRAILQLGSIHRYADPMGGLNLSVMGSGDYLRWHFDQTDFVTSLSIQTSEEGGDFEFVPRIRSREDECYGEVAKVLAGKHPGVQRIANHPGTLLLFKGRDSIHRVTTIKGERPRLMGLLAYDERPGVVSTDHLRQIRYGRTTPYENSPFENSSYK